MRLLIALPVLAAATLSLAEAWALGFGSVRANAFIGQPLDASVVMRLEPGETLSDQCVAATVKAGDNLVPQDQVSASFIHPPGFEARVRVRTWVPIAEPFVTMTVSAGCEMRIARQFTLFVDPPPTVVTFENSTAAPAPTPALAVTPPSAAPSPGAPRVVAGAAAAPPRTTGRQSTGAVKRPPRERSTAAVAVNRSRAAAVAAAPAVPAPAETEAERKQAQRTSTGAVTRGESVALLKLDSPVVSTPGDSPLAREEQQKEDAIKTAKIAVDMAEAANAAAVKRIAEVETQLAQARKDLSETRDALEKLRSEQLARQQMPDVYTIGLAAACGLLLLIAGALYLRQRRFEAERLQGWLKDPSRFSRYSEFDTVAPLTQQFPDFPRTMTATAAGRAPQAPGASGQAASAPAAAAVVAAPAAPSVPFTETEPSSTEELGRTAQAHDISIEELLDVEQQAEFFIVLGQDDAAIDLLSSHVMASGGASPMPYLKLLEIFRRIGDQASYERTRKRFNARFNGVAPEWGADPNAGRALDDYAEVMRRIELAWTDPVDAMTELQTLMFRNDSNLLFDLPAYRDIMLLFTVARDLHDSAPDSATSVDVLLPLGSAVGDASTPATHAEGAEEQSDAPSGTPLRLVSEIPTGVERATVNRR